MKRHSKGFRDYQELSPEQSDSGTSLPREGRVQDASISSTLKKVYVIDAETNLEIQNISRVSEGDTEKMT